MNSFVLLRNLHELDGCSIGVTDIDHALPGVWSRLESLRFAGRFPTGRCDRAQHRIKIIDRQCDVDRSGIARSKIDMFLFGRREVLEQLDLVSGRFDNGDGNLGAGHSGDFTGEITGLMRAMRKLESENIT